MHARGAFGNDLDGVWALQQRWDIAFLGASEHDRDEVWDSLGRAEPMAQRTRVWFRRDALVAAAWYRGGATWMVVDPDVDPAGVYPELVAWLEKQGVSEVEALSTDQARRRAL